MKRCCPNPSCSHAQIPHQNWSKNGHYVRKSDRKIRYRFKCNFCKKTNSNASASTCFRQKLRHFNQKIWKLYCSSYPKRRIARDLKISRTTVDRKITWLSFLKLHKQSEFLKALGKNSEVYLDDMKSYIHTRCRPVCISFAVTDQRKILGFEISPCMPNSPRLIEMAQKKYAPVLDESAIGFKRLLEKCASHIDPKASIITDEHHQYPKAIQSVFPCSRHTRYKSKRAVIAGQGELKEKGYDPLFAINHTFAMIRAHVSRLVRSTWCTSKTIKGLKEHLNLYVYYHNTVLT